MATENRKQMNDKYTQGLDYACEYTESRKMQIVHTFQPKWHDNL